MKTLLMLIAAILLSAQGAAKSPTASPLTGEVVSLDLSHASIIEALRELRAKANGGKVFFTLEVAPFKTSPEKTLNLHSLRSSVGQVLNSIIRQDPSYDFEVLDSRLIHVFPRNAKRDGHNLLNIQVKNLKLSARYDLLLQYPQYHIPQLQTTVFPEGVGPGSMLGSANAPIVNVAVEKGTVRDVLNLVAQKTEQLQDVTPRGWIFTFQLDPALPLGGRPLWQLF